MLQKVREDVRRSGFWLYGTRGYGKSHLLAALVCYLTATGDRVVYIPDCRACVEDPILYVRTAMLFAWANDDTTLEKIVALSTMEEIAQFFQSPRLEVIFVIDQMNGLEVLEKSKTDIRRSYEEVYLWLVRCRVRQKAILSASANYGPLCLLCFRTPPTVGKAV